MINVEEVVKLGIRYGKAVQALKEIAWLDPRLWKTAQKIAVDTLCDLGEEREN